MGWVPALVAPVPEYRVSEPGWLSHSESSHWPRALWLFILGVRLPFVPHTAQMFNTFEKKHLISLSCSGEGKAAGLVQETTNVAAGFYQPQCTWSAWLLAACVFLCDLPRGSTLRWKGGCLFAFHLSYFYYWTLLFKCFGFFFSLSQTAH